MPCSPRQALRAKTALSNCLGSVSSREAVGVQLMARMACGTEGTQDNNHFSFSFASILLFPVTVLGGEHLKCGQGMRKAFSTYNNG